MAHGVWLSVIGVGYVETMSTTRHISDNTTGPVAHLDADSTVIEDSLAILAAAGLEGWVVCDGSCSGLAGCTVAPLDSQPAVAA